MPTGINIYEPILIEMCASEFPMWRKIMCRFSDRHRLSREEYEEWFWKRIGNNNPND